MKAVSKGKCLKAFKRQKLSPAICDFAYLAPMIGLVERIVGSHLIDPPFFPHLVTQSPIKNLDIR